VSELEENISWLSSQDEMIDWSKKREIASCSHKCRAEVKGMGCEASLMGGHMHI